MISVLIVNYHCANLTLNAVESVLSDEKEIEVIVVDNSAEPTELLILQNLLPAEVTLLSSGYNEGFAKACNRAYQQSQGDMILLLNPDAYLLPGALAQMKSTLANYPRAGAVGPRIYWDSDRKFLLPPSIIPSPLRNLIGRACLSHALLRNIYSKSFRRNAISYWSADTPLRQPALSGGHMLLSRNAVEQSGGLFDEQFFMYFEDTDLVLRLRQAGYHLYFEPRAECVHHYQHSANKMKLMGESGPQFYQKHFRKSMITRFSDWLPHRTPDFEGIIPLGQTLISPAFEVPLPLQQRWLFELGFSSSFVPSIGYFGSGEIASIPDACWKLLHAGRYFARISAPDSLVPQSCWTWEIPESGNN
ncbi:MAG: glycosyltransferase family 2 protein [Methylobacter sp.]